MRTLDFDYFKNTVNAMRVDRVINRPVGIIGLARSGLAAAKLLKRLGGNPFVSDAKPESRLEKELAELKEAEIPFETGGHTDKLLEESEYLIVSPGVPKEIPILERAQEIGIPIFSELEVASWLCDANLAAVTGSNGKTTTTTLLGRIFETARIESTAAGNIGYAFSEVCDRISSRGWIALEVSSAQLERIFDFHPHIAIVLNLTPDHLDRYGTFEEYARVKMRVAENLTGVDFLIANADDDYLVQLVQPVEARKIFFSLEKKLESGIYLEDDKIVFHFGELQGDLGSRKDLSIPGPHNLYNAMAAGAAALAAGVSSDAIKETFKTFGGVEHRLEYVDTINGIRYINDSKGTNIDSVWYALQSVPENTILIMGGKYKGGELSRLNELIRQKIKHLILIGEAAETFHDAYKNIVPVGRAETLEDAVFSAADIGHDGDTVLLSPACASFDMFKDFEHRGQVFKDAVLKLKARNKE
ncbi:MAG: UDP-N-acetylmuramoyl-L-alanine--D-glutamate ligase [candidate division Zixibacteria bacterium]|nr:UDP-N-acetylmuramoyl-L-alanine--D-glutamate ligase [candidate division Zixibacteria bacterium]